MTEILNQLKIWARAIKRDVTALYLAARDPATPWYVRWMALCIAAYALSPIDLIPDFIPVVGLLDEAVILPLAILGVIKLIPPEDLHRFRAAADALQDKPVSRAAAAVIVVIWVLALGAGLYTLSRVF